MSSYYKTLDTKCQHRYREKLRLPLDDDPNLCGNGGRFEAE